MYFRKKQNFLDIESKCSLLNEQRTNILFITNKRSGCTKLITLKCSSRDEGRFSYFLPLKSGF